MQTPLYYEQTYQYKHQYNASKMEESLLHKNCIYINYPRRKRLRESIV